MYWPLSFFILHNVVNRYKALVTSSRNTEHRPLRRTLVL